MYNIMLVTGSAVMDTGLSAILKETLPEVVQIYRSILPAEIEAVLASTKVSLIIIDLYAFSGPKDSRPIKSLKNVMLRHPSLKVLMLREPMHNKRLFRWMYTIGVKGVLEKNAPLKEISHCIQKIYGHGIFIENETLVELIKQQATARKDIGLGYGNRTKLTERESLVAKLLVEGKSNVQICSLLGLRPSTVSTHKQQVFRKLQVGNLVELGQLQQMVLS